MSKISKWPWVVLALAGPMLTGALLGLRAGPAAMVVYAAGLPVVVALVALLTTPTLYVGGALFGARLALGEVLAATGRGMRAAGVAMLGLAPLTLLLVATSSTDGVPLRALVLLVLGLAAGLHRLATALGEEMGAGPRPALGGLLFLGHAAVAFVIGARLFFDLQALATGVTR